MAHADEKIAFLSKELNNLKEQQLIMAENNDFLQNQMKHRDDEIKRLSSLLQEGRPIQDIKQDCCYKNVDRKLNNLQNQITTLQQEKNLLQCQLQEALAKQHEAMRRALHLAEQNKQLEKEMKDIDQMALAVEAECNETIRENAEKLTRFQDQLNEGMISLQNLERENQKLKQSKAELSADLDAVILEKKHLQRQLENEVENKKRLTDRINNFTIIENDLNLEIDKLMQISAEQKRKIVELESQLVEAASIKATLTEENVDEDISSIKMVNKQVQSTKSKQSKSRSSPTPVKSVKNKSKPSTKRPSLGESSSTTTKDAKDCFKCCCEAGSCIKNLKELLDRELEYRQTNAQQAIELLRQEKEYYMKEYHKLLEPSRKISSHDNHSKMQSDRQDFVVKDRKIAQMEQQIADLERELRARQEKLESLTSSDMMCGDGVCGKSMCRRREREMEILRDNLKHTEMENNTLKMKIQTLNETTVFNEERMKKAFQEMEEHIRKLEDERRDLVKNDITSRSNVTRLEEEYKAVKEQLRTSQNELNTVKSNYNQLKVLQQQSDRALSEAQSQQIRSETELAMYKSKIKSSSQETVQYEQELAKLNNDIQVMQKQLTKLDKEKDDLLNTLDEKAEKIAALEEQLQEKNNTIAKLEMELNELQRKLNRYTDDSSNQQLTIRSTLQELNGLQKECDKERCLKESALLENRRLRDNLTSVTLDCKRSHNELEIAKREIDDLKTQLQQYVAEVKRTEDLITQKERERNELLDQFRSLSQEADVLENTNHSLENEATQSRVQLSVALDHTSELERKLDNQESIIRSYEKQIIDLTSQIASLEMQVKQNTREQQKSHEELQQMRDLCCKLDREKDSLQREVLGREDRRSQIEGNVSLLQKEKEALERALEKEKRSIDELEHLLCQSREEAIKQRLVNQDLQSEIDRLKQKADIQDSLSQPVSPEILVSSAKNVQRYETPKQVTNKCSDQCSNKPKENASKNFVGQNVLKNPEDPGILSKELCVKSCNITDRRQTERYSQSNKHKAESFITKKLCKVPESNTNNLNTTYKDRYVPSSFQNLETPRTSRGSFSFINRNTPRKSDEFVIGMSLNEPSKYSKGFSNKPNSCKGEICKNETLTNDGVFKKVFIVEGTGVQSCVSNYKVMHSKPPSTNR